MHCELSLATAAKAWLLAWLSPVDQFLSGLQPVVEIFFMLRSFKVRANIWTIPNLVHFESCLFFSKKKFTQPQVVALIEKGMLDVQLDTI